MDNKFKTIQYMGSKRNLTNFIEIAYNKYKEEFSEFNPKTFLDVFCGSGSVSYHFRNKFNITSNDKLSFSKVIMDAYLCSKKPVEYYQKFINHLNNISENSFEESFNNKDVDGWLVDKYSGDTNNVSNVDEHGNRKIWSIKNAKRIELMLAYINKLELENKIDYYQKCVLTLCIMLGINKISNVLGHQNGYLKKWSKNTLLDIKIEMPTFLSEVEKEHHNFCLDVFDFLNLIKIQADLAYFDPPYGTNNVKLSVSTRYSSFYHLWDTLITSSPFNRPEVFGKANKPTSTKGWTCSLEKNDKSIVMPKLIRLIEQCNAKYISFSYSNKGLLTYNDMKEVFRLAGCDMNSFRLFAFKHYNNSQRKTAKKYGIFISRDNEDDDLYEYLFIAKKKSYHQNIPIGNVRIIKNSTNETIEILNDVENYLLNSDKNYSFSNDLPYLIIIE